MVFLLSSFDSDKVQLLDRELESDKVELELALDRTLEMLDTIFPAPSEKKTFNHREAEWLELFCSDRSPMRHKL